MTKNRPLYPSILMLVLVILAIPSFVSSQQQLSSKLLPNVGDKQYRVASNIEVSDSYLEKTANGDYNYSFVSFPYVSEDRFAETKEGKYYAYFPKADFVLLKTDGQEEYYRKTDTRLYLMGRSITTSFTKSKTVIQTYSPAQLIVDTDWEPGTSYNSIYKSRIKVPVSDLRGRYGIIPAGTDSIMLDNLIREKTKVKPWTQMVIFEAAEKVQEHVIDFKNKFYFKIKNKDTGKWDEKSTSNRILPQELEVATDYGTGTRHTFYSNTYNGKYLSYTQNDAKRVNETKDPIRMTFQDNKNKIKVRKTFDSGPDVIAYPNPSYGPTTFELIGMPPQDVRIEVYNIIGKQLFNKSYRGTNGLTIAEDLGFLNKGTYMYSFFDEKGRKIKTKRIAIMGI